MIKSPVWEFVLWAFALFIAALLILGAVAMWAVITDLRQVRDEFQQLTIEGYVGGDGCEEIDP